MKNRWPHCKLGDVCRIVPGFAFKSSDWVREGIPVVKIKNIVGDSTVDMNDADCVPVSLLTPKLDKFSLRDRDILLAMTGATAGKTGRIRTTKVALLNQRVAKIEPTLIEPDFIWAIVSSSEYQERFFKLADGAAQPNMSGAQIENVLVPVPPAPFQQRIASILSAYDDLIENNTRRIAVLEEMARRIFEEWFVHFRAPGCESLPRIDTPLGPVPEGWEVVRLDQLAAVNPEQISPKNPPEQISYIDIASVSPGRIDQVVSMPFGEAPGRARRIVRDGDTLWSCVRPNRRSHALVIDPEPDWVASTGFAVLRPHGTFSAFLYFSTTAESFVSYLVGRATGAAYPAVKSSDFEEATLIKPPNELIARFRDCADPMMCLEANLHRQNQNLRAQRDLLLPKLISGEIDVSDAPAILEAAE